MAVRLVRENGDASFLQAMEGLTESSPTTGAVLCRFSLSPHAVQSDAVLAAVAKAINSQGGEIYFCKNRDVVIVWQGPLSQTTTTIKGLIKDHFRGIVNKVGESAFFQFFDVREQLSTVRSFFSQRLNDSTISEADEERSKTALHFTDDQLTQLAEAIKARTARRGLTTGLMTMVVEDQEFSSKLLSNFLLRSHRCVTAKSAAEMLQLYAKHAPEILYLDIELPDASGHDLAALIKQHDPESFVIMVTANSYARDIDAAMKNKVQGYITKPFQPQKIQASIDQYVKIYRN